MKQLSLKQRIVIGVLASILGCIVQMLYWQYLENRSPWKLIPQYKWEQVGAQLRHGVSKPAPLDSVTIMADLQDWLRSKHM